MSHQDISLKAASADGFYHPQEWDPSKGSLDSFQRKRGYEHHFGKQRVKNVDKGLLLIRFEMPFKVQCLRCQTYIGQGTRYDADKKKVGNYFSTPIFSFAMRCGVIVDHEKSADGGVHCNQRFVIQTDPRNDDYALMEGLRRKVETWDPESAGSTSFPSREERHKMDSDPMFKMEKTIRNKKREQSEKERLRDLEELREEREDDYDLNCMLRRRCRGERKQRQAEEEAARLAGPANFCLPLQPAAPEDAAEASKVVFRTDQDRVDVAARRAAAGAAPLFERQANDGSRRLQELVAKRRRLTEHARIAQVFGRG